MDIVTLSIIIGGIIIVIWGGRAFLGSAKKHGEQMSEQDLEQLRINRLARGTDEERYHGLGVSMNEASKKGGCMGKLIIFGIIIVVFLLLFDQFVGNGEILRSIFER